jgi:hypothetical protein
LSPCVEFPLRTVDPHGTPLDFYVRMDQGERMLQRYAIHQGARIQRIDHINCFTPDVQTGYDFFREIASASLSTPKQTIPTRCCGRFGCTARAMCTTSPSPMDAARGCIT